MKIVGSSILDELSLAAQGVARRRFHRNLHDSWEQPCQRTLNAICSDSYIPPHRHSLDGRPETLVAVRGRFALITFQDGGDIEKIYFLSPGGGSSAMEIAVADVPALAWHTVVSIEPVSILLEIKAGPFDPNKAKEFAAWAPRENSEESSGYLDGLRKVCIG